ncbi:MAG: sigma-70 family RNA polymerase sigma factor, partial [Armatimonadetes bacterium]|nr:sigma-70 family RNA polymerase sigma factor [Armatimonadota bacterium]
ICLEKRRRARPANEPEREDAAPSGDFAGQIDARIALETALESLPESLRVALILREWHGLSYEEMASVLAIPVGTVRSRLHQARAEFRQIWQKMEAE